MESEEDKVQEALGETAISIHFCTILRLCETSLKQRLNMKCAPGPSEITIFTAIAESSESYKKGFKLSSSTETGLGSSKAFRMNDTN